MRYDQRAPPCEDGNFGTVGLSQKHITFPIYVAAYMFEVFLYGMYIILFSACMFLLLKNKSSLKWPLLLSAITMFALSTASVTMTVYILFGFLVPGKPMCHDITHPKYIFYCINSVIADALIISRCYAVWNNSKRIIAIPCLLLLASAVAGLLFNGAPASNVNLRSKLCIYLWLTLGLNVMVTFLTAIRIWWMARRTSQILGPGIAKKYYSAFAIIIESGAIYSLYILLDQVAGTFILDSGLTQVVGMVPTLIIVQVGLGRHIKHVDTTVTIVRGENHPPTSRFNPSLTNVS